VLALTLVAGACTTTQNAANDDGVDKARMSMVERTASERGVRIYWVNPPQKTLATQSGG